MTRWLPGYKYRKKLTATASGSNATDYQVMWRVYYIAGTDATNQVFIPKCKTDLSDIRFTLDDGYSTLPFWVESPAITGSGWNVWVKVPSILTTGTAVYLYYGRDSVASASDGNKCFDFFDDFEGSALDTTKWEKGTQYTVDSVSNSIIRGHDAASQVTSYLKSVAGIWSPGYAIRGRSMEEQTNKGTDILSFGSPASGDASSAGRYAYSDAKNYTYSKGSSAGTQVLNSADTNYHIYDTCVAPTVVNCYDNGVLIYTTTTANQIPTSTTMKVILFGANGMGAGGGYNNADWILVRKYVATEPTCTVSGIEESYSIQPIIQKGWRY